MSILFLWNIQLTSDWDGIMPYGACHHNSELKCCKRVQEFFKSGNFCRSYRNFRTGKVNVNGIDYVLYCTVCVSNVL